MILCLYAIEKHFWCVCTATAHNVCDQTNLLQCLSKLTSTTLLFTTGVSYDSTDAGCEATELIITYYVRYCSAALLRAGYM
jgi:hypothetical protein